MKNNTKTIKELEISLDDVTLEKNQLKRDNRTLTTDLDSKIEEREENNKKISTLDKKNRRLQNDFYNLEVQKRELEDKLKFIINILEDKNDNFRIIEELQQYIYSHKQRSSEIMLSFFLELEESLTHLFNFIFNIEFEIKTLVSLGGAVSYGKSSFLNSLLGNMTLLPTGDLPITSIPSFIIDGEDNSIECITENNKKSLIKFKDFQKMSVRNHLEDNDSLNWKKVISYFLIRTSFKKELKHICFIDTPGYNPATRTDEDRAVSKKYIKKTEKLIWIISVINGSISNSDFCFLEEILADKKNISIYIIINRADDRSDETLKSICDEIKKELDLKNIKVEGISPYTSDITLAEYNERYFKQFGYGISLYEFLSCNLKNNSIDNKIKNIKDIFDKYKDKYKDSIIELNNIYNTHNIEILERSQLVYKYASLVPIIVTELDKTPIMNDIEKYCIKKIKDYKNALDMLSEIRIETLLTINNIIENI